RTRRVAIRLKFRSNHGRSRPMTQPTATSVGGTSMTAYRIISSDSHVFEPADLWTSRIDKPFRERAPRVISDGQYDQWVVEDGKKVGSIGLVSQAGVRFEAP